MIDLLSGEHLQPAYLALNPNGLVPLLEDGAFRLAESSAILKYLADHVGSAAYPRELRARARVNEVMDWVNSNLHRDLGYNMVYPQLLPHHRREPDAAQAATIDWGRTKTRKWLATLNQSMLGPGKAFLCGETPTIADYFAAPIVTLLDLVRCDDAKYRNVTRWLANVRALPGWTKVNEALDGWTASLQAHAFATL